MEKHVHSGIFHWIVVCKHLQRRHLCHCSLERDEPKNQALSGCSYKKAVNLRVLFLYYVSTLSIFEVKRNSKPHLITFNLFWLADSKIFSLQAFSSRVSSSSPWTYALFQHLNQALHVCFNRWLPAQFHTSRDWILGQTWWNVVWAGEREKGKWSATWICVQASVFKEAWSSRPRNVRVGQWRGQQQL